ncbi:PREDICTED: FXYD domain-containing ion transport regulator 5 [Condylura cristata]|uniref:FXYD domain-containing ion transport regulator 5 n=1 Tax=Condylura cristata TaxID=143302 RepID=UPI00064372F2|nr:PREDICTED: FXYD domain-containing ion transport regulator 5 [Condylura cristata]
MTEPVWVPPAGLPWPHPPPGSCRALRVSEAAGSTARSAMSPAGRLCLLTLVGLVLPTRGQKLENTSISPEHTPATDIYATTEIQEKDNLEMEPTLLIAASTPNQRETQTQHPSGTSVLQTSTPSVDKSPAADPAKVTTPSERPAPADRVSQNPADSNEDDPFYYDVYTLRKRGLLIAAVLFITGIVIFTSGKCRRLPQLCRSICRDYTVVSEAQSQPAREDMDGV